MIEETQKRADIILEMAQQQALEIIARAHEGNPTVGYGCLCGCWLGCSREPGVLRLLEALEFCLRCRPGEVSHEPGAE
jgi:hypothetical protein